MMQYTTNNPPISADKNFNSVISLNDLCLDIHLGVGDEERNTKQKVKISFKFFYKDRPVACDTDNLQDTICYDKTSQEIADLCKSRQFCLLEYLVKEIYDLIRASTDEGVAIWIKAEKCEPPVEGLLGNTSFEYTDI